jgi:hypothetical protein
MLPIPDSVYDRMERFLAKETRTMRKFRTLLAVLTLAGFAVGCESEAPKKPPEQKSDLGTPASPKTATDTPATTPANK